MEKREFMLLVLNTIYDHPDWFAEMVQVANQGVLDRIEYLIAENTDLAAGLSWLCMTNEKDVLKQSERISRGLYAMLDNHYYGSNFEKEFRKKLDAKG